MYVCSLIVCMCADCMYAIVLGVCMFAEKKREIYYPELLCLDWLFGGFYVYRPLDFLALV